MDNIENTVYRDAMPVEEYTPTSVSVALGEDGEQRFLLMCRDPKAKKGVDLQLSLATAREISHRLDVALIRQERRELEERWSTRPKTAEPAGCLNCGACWVLSYGGICNSEDKRHLYHCISCGWTVRDTVEDDRSTVFIREEPQWPMGVAG